MGRLPLPRYAPRSRQGGWIVNPYRFSTDDSYWPYVVNLTHFDDIGSPPLTTCQDFSPLGIDFTINTSVASISSSQYLFGGGSISRVGGAATAAAQTVSDNAYQFRTNSWTIEFAYRIAALSTSNQFDMRAGTANVRAVTLGHTSGGVFQIFVNGALRITSAAGVVVAGRWQRFCACRVGTNTRLFVDGVQVGSTWVDTNDYDAAFTRLQLGSSFGANPTNANWDEVRVTNGIGRYASNYTVAPAAFPIGE